jgi:hypothetical protein
MIADKLIAPVFSIALAPSDAHESYIAFGGLPPVKTHGKFASSPMLLVRTGGRHMSIHVKTVRLMLPRIPITLQPSYQYTTSISTHSRTKATPEPLTAS